MKTGSRMLRYGVLAIACAALAGRIIPLPQAAIAEDGAHRAGRSRAAEHRPGIVHDDIWDDGWDDFNRTQLQMQRESIASQEEQAREAGRALRRDEIEKNQQKAAAEHEAYFDAILGDSQEALRAPLGVYYRKPGYTAAEGPGGGAGSVEIGGLAYFYDRGIFWLNQGAGYIVVTAPVGAVVDRLPQGVTRLPSGSGPVWYFFGTFFGEKGGTYEVIKPPAGLTVFYLPDGYSQENVKGVGLYRFGDVLYKPVFVQGVLAYQVTEP